MKIKLSDFILENSINNADVVDIEMEQFKAQINVCCELANLYIKQMNMVNVFQEVAPPAQQPPTVPTGQDLQQPSYSYSQDIDSDMPEGWNSNQQNNTNNPVLLSALEAFQEQGVRSTHISFNYAVSGHLIYHTASGRTDYYSVAYQDDIHTLIIYLTNDLRPFTDADRNNPYYPYDIRIEREFKIDTSRDVKSQISKHIQDAKNNIAAYYNDTENTQQQETPQQQQNPISAKTVAALVGAIIALAAFISKFLGYLNRMTNTGLNLIRIKESIDASKKYIDMIYGMALNNNFNDSDFNEFTRQFQELINLVERSIANSGNKPTDQRYVQNAQGIINSPEVKDMMSKIQQIQNARFKQQLDSSLQNINPQNLQRFNSDFQRLKNGMTQMLESSMQEAKSTSYQQFKPAQQTQTTYQSQPQQTQQGQVSQMQ